MAVGQGGCMRMLGFIMSVAIVLSIFAVSYESEFWHFWGAGNVARGDFTSIQKSEASGGRKVNGLADAAPIQKSYTDDLERLDTDAVEEAGGTTDDVDVAEKENDGEEVPSSPQDASDVPLTESTSPAPAPESLLEPSGDKNQSSEDSTQSQGEGEGSTASEVAETAQDSLAGESTDDLTESPQYAYQSLRKSRAKSFLVVFMGHSGSTAFTTELRTHTEFEVELLEPLEHGEYQKNTDLALRKAREIMDRGIAKGKIPGFKIRPFHIQNKPQEWRDFVKEYDTRVIWQYRENLMKQAIGEYRHRFLNDSSVVEGLSRNQKPCEEGSDQKCRIEIENMRGLHGLLNDFTASDELLSAAARSLRRDNDMTIVKYEDYLYYRQRTMRETFDFFGVDYQDTAPQRLKASPDSLCEMVSNFQDLCDHFLPCQLWRPFLHDDVNDCRCKPGSWQSFDSTYCKRNAWYQGN